MYLLYVLDSPISNTTQRPSVTGGQGLFPHPALTYDFNYELSHLLKVCVSSVCSQAGD